MISDATLIRNARKDPEGFGEFCRRHIAAVESVLRREVGDPHVAADLTAETFAIAWQKVKRFKDDRDGSGLPWLYGIARNLALKYHREQRIQRRAIDKLGIRIDHSLRSFEDDVITAVATEQMRPTTENALAQLPASQQAAVRMRVVDEKSYSEVADALDCSQANARMHVSRGLRALKPAFQGERS